MHSFGDLRSISDNYGKKNKRLIFNVFHCVASAVSAKRHISGEYLDPLTVAVIVKTFSGNDVIYLVVVGMIVNTDFTTLFKSDRTASANL